MKQLLIIPDIKNPAEAIGLAEEYSLGFEYNDFFIPDVLDNEQKMAEIISEYQKLSLPSYCTLHGAFFDVIPFSPDGRIREVSALRIKQSLDAARKIGARAVVFHTNYNPFLNSDAYIKGWIEQNKVFWSGVLETNSDIGIYLENMFDTTPDIMEELSETLSEYDNYGVCLDYAHASLSKAPADEWAKRLGRFVKHIHINDNDMVSDLHLAWGDGIIDRNLFYKCYEDYMNGATVLIETSTAENRERSLRMLKTEGFIS